MIQNAAGVRRPSITSLLIAFVAPALAVAGALAGAPAQAASPRPGSAAVASQSARPASAPAPAKRVAARTVGVPFAWPDGRPVRATVVTRASATVKKASGLRGYAAVGNIWDDSGVLPDGRQVGVINGVVKVREKSGSLRNYFSGSAPKVAAVLVQGTTVLGISFGGSTTRGTVFTGAGKKASKTTTLPGQNLLSVALSCNRLYYSLPTGKPGAYSSQLRSVAVGGTSSSVVAKQAADPQVADNGELFYITVATSATQMGGRPAGVKSLKSGKTTLRTTGTKTLGQSVWDDQYAPLVVTGRIVSMENVGGRGTLIMDTVARKAWFVQASGGKYAGTASHAGSRVLTTSIDPYNPPYVGAREFGLFDTSTGRYTVYTTNFGVARGAINGSAVTFVTEPGLGRFSTGSGLLR